jgi:hypothetical protein
MDLLMILTRMHTRYCSPTDVRAHVSNVCFDRKMCNWHSKCFSSSSVCCFSSVYLCWFNYHCFLLLVVHYQIVIGGARHWDSMGLLNWRCHRCDPPSPPPHPTSPNPCSSEKVTLPLVVWWSALFIIVFPVCLVCQKMCSLQNYCRWLQFIHAPRLKVVACCRFVRRFVPFLLPSPI